MTNGQAFRLNQGVATGKVMGTEAVVINVVTGRYYSMLDAACIAWIVLSGGGTVDGAVDAIVERYDADPGAVRADVVALLEELLSEQLVVAADAAGDPDLPPPEPRQPYEPISLQTFRDMEELLAFDPPLPWGPDPATRPPEW